MAFLRRADFEKISLGPTPKLPQSGDLFRFPLAEHLNPKQDLMRVVHAMDWSLIVESFVSHFASKTGRLALPARLVVGLLFLQHAYGCSEEAAVRTCV
jgi:hypothetical protein